MNGHFELKGSFANKKCTFSQYGFWIINILQESIVDLKLKRLKMWNNIYVCYIEKATQISWEHFKF